MSSRLEPALRKDPPSLNEYWSLPANNTTGRQNGTATLQSTNEDEWMPQSPSPNHHRTNESIRNRDSYPVLPSGEVVTAKNTVRSNSHIIETVPQSVVTVPSHTNKDTIGMNHDNVLVDACLVDCDLSDGVNRNSNDAQLPVQQIPMASADTDVVHLASSNSNAAVAAAEAAPVAAAASRIQVPKKYIPCMAAALVVVFGAGVGAGICGAGLCASSNKGTASLLTPATIAPTTVTGASPTTKPISSTMTPISVPAAPTSSPNSSFYNKDPNSTVTRIRSPNTTAPATTSTRSPSRAKTPTLLANLTDAVDVSPAPPPVETANPSMTSSNRAASIVNYINFVTGRAITVPTTSTEALAPEEAAVQWLIVDDPLQLTPDTAINQFRMQQRYALLTLMVQQGWGSQWTQSSNDECEWTGIACTEGVLDGESAIQVVVGISLPSSTLQGSIPADLGLLSKLQSLDVSFNSLSGSLPDSIGNWLDLQQFLVHDNSLTGTIPETIVSWSQVDIIQLGSNQFTGSIPQGICDGRFSYLGADCAFKVTCSCCTVCSDLIGF
jgi:hypothetical protein